MAKKSADTTNAVRHITAMKLEFSVLSFECPTALSATEISAMLSIPGEKVFKTLVTVGRSGEHYVFMVPAGNELDLKNAARAVGEKSIEMIKNRELLPLTGYIHGGCSPIGMKKQFVTVLDESAAGLDTIFFSGGKLGLQIEMSPSEFKKAVDYKLFDVCKRSGE